MGAARISNVDIGRLCFRRVVLLVDHEVGNVWLRGRLVMIDSDGVVWRSDEGVIEKVANQRLADDFQIVRE